MSEFNRSKKLTKFGYVAAGAGPLFIASAWLIVPLIFIASI